MTTLTTKDAPLSQAQRQWYEAACEKIDLGRLKQLIFDLTAQHSPPGPSGRLANSWPVT